LHDVETKIFDQFADEAVVHPGHGDDTTSGAERPQLAEWQATGWCRDCWGSPQESLPTPPSSSVCDCPTGQSQGRLWKTR